MTITTLPRPPTVCRVNLEARSTRSSSPTAKAAIDTRCWPKESTECSSLAKKLAAPTCRAIRKHETIRAGRILGIRHNYFLNQKDVHFTLNPKDAIYDIPGLSHGPRRLTNGWKLSTTVSFRTGLPFTLYAAGDSSGTGENYDRVNQIAANPYAGVSHSVTNGQPVQWVNPAAFANPAPGTFGTEARNSLIGPGFSDVDLSILKDTAINERVRAQFRVEIFNLFNRVNLASPSFTGTNYLTGSSTAIIATTNGVQLGQPGIGPGEPFNVQLALKILL
jgi:hypothetical protein